MNKLRLLATCALLAVGLAGAAQSAILPLVCPKFSAPPTKATALRSWTKWLFFTERFSGYRLGRPKEGIPAAAFLARRLPDATMWHVGPVFGSIISMKAGLFGAFEPTSTMLSFINGTSNACAKLGGKVNIGKLRKAQTADGITDAWQSLECRRTDSISEVIAAEAIGVRGSRYGHIVAVNSRNAQKAGQALGNFDWAIKEAMRHPAQLRADCTLGLNARNSKPIPPPIMGTHGEN